MTKTTEEKAAYQRDYRQKKLLENPNYYSDQYKKNKEYYIDHSSKRAKEQADERRSYYRDYRANPIKKQRLNALASNFRSSPKGKALNRMSAADRRHLIRHQKISKFHREEIKKIYVNCPDGMVVDHEVPIKGKHVCGLHVPWNLQYLTPTDNGRKGNKYE